MIEINKCTLLIRTAQFLTVCCYHVTYAFQSESTLYSCLNVKKLLARNTQPFCQTSVRLRTKWLWVRVPFLSLKRNFCFKFNILFR